jgi:hypothetical protein
VLWSLDEPVVCGNPRDPRGPCEEHPDRPFRPALTTPTTRPGSPTRSAGPRRAMRRSWSRSSPRHGARSWRRPDTTSTIARPMPRCARLGAGEPRALHVHDGKKAMLLPLLLRDVPAGGRDATSRMGAQRRRLPPRGRGRLAAGVQCRVPGPPSPFFTLRIVLDHEQFGRLPRARDASWDPQVMDGFFPLYRREPGHAQP